MSARTDVLPSIFKRCCRCHESKAAPDFNRCTGKRDGLQPYCRGCQRDYNRAWHSGTPS